MPARRPRRRAAHAPRPAAAGSARPPEAAVTSFVTGATGFIGRHLVERLLEREGDIHVLVREESLARLEELLERWGPDARGRIMPLTGDITLPRLGLDDETRA